MTALPSWDARIRRAEQLSRKIPGAKEILSFYSAVAGFQRESYRQFTSSRAPLPPKTSRDSIRGELDFDSLVRRFPAFLSLVESAAPAPLAEFAREFSSQKEEWQTLLRAYWEKGARFEPVAEERHAFCARAFLQPYAEYFAARSPRSQDPPASERICPVCLGMPQVAALRPEGDGARRSLICAFCTTEWEFRRIVCPSCGEEEEKKLSVYVAKEFEIARVEACETCRSYIEAIDLTKDGHAIPVVDELTCIPLGLWAAGQNYHKVQPNLFGM
jgi:FdhE protein